MLLQYDWTALHWASWNGHENTVTLLIEHGANVNVFDQVCNTTYTICMHNFFYKIINCDIVLDTKILSLRPLELAN